MTEEVYPIPGHCVYLTEGLGCEEYRLILDTERGTSNFALPECFADKKDRHYKCIQHHGL